MQTALTGRIRNTKKAFFVICTLPYSICFFKNVDDMVPRLLTILLPLLYCLLKMELDQPGWLLNRYKTFIILILLSLMEETHRNLNNCFHLSWHKFLPTLYAYISKKNKSSNIMQLQNTFQVCEFTYLVIHKYFRFFATFDFQYTLPLCRRCLRAFARCLEIGFFFLRFCVTFIFGSVFLPSNFLRIIMSSVLENT